MSLTPALQRGPASGYLKDECGLPMGWLVCPFAKADPAMDPGRVSSSSIGRCRECYGYINHLCVFLTRSWSCALCGADNDLTTLANRRYANKVQRRSCPELQAGLVEAACPLDLPPGTDSGEDNTVYEAGCSPVYLALIDATGGPVYMELMKGAVLAALEAMPACALFGLATFSSEIALYSCQRPVASLRRVPLIQTGDHPTPLDLQDALPLSQFLAPVGQYKDAISAAVEALQPDAEGTLAPTEHRGFGPALQTMLRYLGSYAEAGDPASATGRADSGKSASTSAPASAFQGARLLAFLAGPPNRGRGSVLRNSQHLPVSRADPHAQQEAFHFDPTNPELSFYLPSSPRAGAGPRVGVQMVLMIPCRVQQMLRLDERAEGFYGDAAAAAGALNVCVDVWAASDEPCGLASMRALCTGSGGSLNHYACAETSTMPQDVYRRLVAPVAMRGLLRVRTSPELSVTRFYGPLISDETLDSMAHVALADASTTFALDLKHVQSGRLEQEQCMQMAFSYSVCVPAGGQGSHRYLVQRRLRILTIPLRVASSARDVFDHVDAEVVAAVLMHKVILVAQVDGRDSARDLLRDWLARLIAGYNAIVHGPSSITSSEQVDIGFEKAEALQPLARLTYGLMHSLLLRPSVQGEGISDAAAAMQALWSALPPQDLARAVYPLLTSYSDPDTLAFPRHSLSRTALLMSGAPIFLMDALTTIIIYYMGGYPPHLPFPPPSSSLVRKSAAQLRGSRRHTPPLLMLREGVDDTRPFTSRLIEEDEPGRASFVAFLDNVAEDAWQHLQRRS